MGNFYRYGLFTFILAAISAGCTISDATPPPLQGPSELGLSLTMFANPDVLSQDGASQAQIVIEARDAFGQLAPNTPMRVEIVYQGTVVDFGTLSSRSIVTGSNGRATVTYTAPTIVGGTAAGTINIRVIPTGNNAANALARVVDIRLVPPGVIIGGVPTASFTFTPASPTAFEDVIFTSTSTAAPGSAIATTSWNFGDGTSASGPVVTHRFASGAYTVTLTVTDTNGFSVSSLQTVNVGTGNVPTAFFTISPSTGNMTNQPIFFNASSSTPGTGRRIVRYDWDFGTGATASGVLVSKSFDQAGSFNVTLTVTDDVGQFDTFTSAVTIAANATSTPTARFTFTPSPGRVNEPMTFDGTPSSTTSGSIARYEWDFDGNGTTDVTTYAPTASVQHTYNTAGAKTVILTVFDTNGSSDSETRTVQVVN